MNFASTLPQTEADFFDEKGVLKQYVPQNQQYQHTGSMYVLRKFQGNPSDDILFSDNGVEIQHNTSTSVSDPDPAPILPPDFPFQEFPLHGSSKPISNRLLQHFRYVGLERMQ